MGGTSNCLEVRSGAVPYRLLRVSPIWIFSVAGDSRVSTERPTWFPDDR